MLEINYTTATKETANATLDFMSNRPVMALLFFSMKVSCYLLCFAFAITLYNKATRPQDIASLLFAVTWLIFHKSINRWMIGNGLKMRKFSEYNCHFKIDDKSILYKLHNFAPQHIEWKRLKHILKNQDGYIIPLTGLGNAGKFFWLPTRSLQGNDEQQFLDFAQKFKLKIKAIAGK